MTRKVVPMIHVPDVAATVDWYRDIGFTVLETHGHEGEGLSFAILAYGDTEVMFSEGGRPSDQFRREVDLYVYADDVDAVFENLKDRVEIVEGLHDTFYGMRELIIRDLNRFWITFGQPSAYGMLMDAVRSSNSEGVRAVLAHGVNPRGLTNALIVATEEAKQNHEIVTLLREAGAELPPDIDEKVLKAHTGKYQSAEGLDATIRLNDGQLFAEAGDENRMRLVASDQNRFRPLVFDRITVTFKSENSRTVGFELQDGSVTTEFNRVG